MFDANLRYQAKGEDGFCEVCSVKEHTKLYNLGVRKGDLLYYKMLSIGSDNPRVKFFTKEGKSITLRSWDTEHESSHFDFLIVYSGEVDLTGFLDQEKEKLIPKALELKEKLRL